MITEYLNKLQAKRNMRDLLLSSGVRVTKPGLVTSKGLATEIENKKNSNSRTIKSSSCDKEVCEVAARKDRTEGAPEIDLTSIRGRIGYMQYIHGFIGCVLVVLALIHLPYPTPLAWLPYAGAALLAFITLKSDLSLGLSRILAISTVAMMFFFFAYFFLLVPNLADDWYKTQFGWAAVSRIVSAFVMIPILSDYSCRLKADCLEERAARRAAFFSVPSHIRPEGR